MRSIDNVDRNVNELSHQLRAEFRFGRTKMNISISIPILYSFLAIARFKRLRQTSISNSTHAGFMQVEASELILTPGCQSGNTAVEHNLNIPVKFCYL